MTNSFVSAIDARVRSEKSQNNKDKLKNKVRPFLASEAVSKFLTETGCTSRFDFDIHSIMAMENTVRFAMGNGSINNVKEDYLHAIKTMLNFEAASLPFTARDIEACLVKTIKLDPAKAKLTSRRTDHYDNAGKWHNRAVKLLTELNMIRAINKSEFRVNDNAISQGFKAAIAKAAA